MPKSTPVRRRTLFVFIPPVVAFIVGLVLILQTLPASSDTESAEQSSISSSQVSAQPRFQYAILEKSLITSQWVVVNKHRPLPKDFQTPELVVIAPSTSLENPRKLKLRADAAEALQEMAGDMARLGAGVLFVNSAHRTYEYQAQLFQSKVKQYGLSLALLKSAKAGYSEHQTGLAVDVSVPEQGCAILECFGETKAGKWIADYSWRYGFIVRYQKDTTAITGYAYEPWHLRFIGKELAKEYHDGGFTTFEEFWNMPAAPDYLAD